MNNEEAQKVLDELQNVRPEMLNGEAKRLFEAIMKIADERDLYKKIINEMADEMADIDYDYMCGNWCGNETGCDGEERATCIKKYFTKKVGE